MEKVCNDALDVVLDFVDIGELILSCRSLSRAWCKRVDGRAFKWVRAVSERAPVLVTLTRRRRDYNPRDKMTEEEDGELVERLFYPSHTLDATCQQVVYAFARRDGPVRMNFTFYDSNAVSQDSDDIDACYGIGFHVSLKLQVPRGSRVTLPLPPSLTKKNREPCPDDKKKDNDVRHGKADECATLGGDLNLYMSDIEYEGMRHNVMWLMGLPQEEDSDDDNDDDDDDDDDRMSTTHEVELQRAIFNVVRRADLFPPILRASYARCMLYQQIDHAIALKTLADMVDTMTCGHHGRLLFGGTHDTRRYLYFHMSRSSDRLLIAMERAGAVLAKERAYVDVSLLDRMSKQNAEVGECLAEHIIYDPDTPDLELEELYMVEFRRLVLLQHITDEVVRRECTLPPNKIGAVHALCHLYIDEASQHKIPHHGDRPLTFDRLIDIVCDTLLLHTCTTYLEREKSGFTKRQYQIEQEEYEERLSRCEYTYREHVHDYSEAPRFDEPQEPIESVADIKTRCQREALGITPAQASMDNLRTRFHAGLVEFA
jgi:hypothetical protein